MCAYHLPSPLLPRPPFSFVAAQWFGPLTTCVARAEEMNNQPYFHGGSKLKRCPRFPVPVVAIFFFLGCCFEFGFMDL